MGNAGSTSMHRERHKSSDLSTPNSPFREMAGRGDSISAASGMSVVGDIGSSGVQTFTFDKDVTNDKNARSVLLGGSSQEDEDQPYYTKPVGSTTTIDANTTPTPRKRANTVSEGSTTLLHNNSGSTMSVKDSTTDSNEDKDENSTIELPRNSGLPTVLRWDGGGKNVMISGTFSKWKPIPMARSHGNFVAIIDLPEGDHQYKFCVDGEWKHDPKLKSIENDDGIKNNLVSVRQSDFEVFQALAKDSENAPNYAEKEYSQEVPQPKPWEKVSGPPVLPPHLLQVILNKDTPLSCEPTLLPEPNHVMLNHLYALSIKDGVMVLSATHRYRKKYVTTLLYKPI